VLDIGNSLLAPKPYYHRDTEEAGGKAVVSVPSVSLWCKSRGVGLFSAKPRKEEGEMSDTPTMGARGEDYPELRESVRRISER
jgi:hypothetical protein